MRSVSFSYTLYHQSPAPIIPLRIKGRWGERPVWVYVDSGASFSILDVSVAEDLGIPYAKGHPAGVALGDGSLILVHVHSLSVRLGPYRFQAALGFSPRLGIGFNLLGRKDVFDRFDVTFSDSRRRITFKPVR